MIKVITNPSLVNPLIASKINEIISEVNRLALDEKKEECKCEWVKSKLTGEDICLKCEKGTIFEKKEEPKPECDCTKMFNGTIADTSDCKIHVNDARLKEPKSTLREAIKKIYNENSLMGDDASREIISLFKDTLLKVVKYKPTGFEGDDYNQGYNQAIMDIRKNL